MLSIYAVSTQYISVAISNSEGINPTSDVVQFAFLGPYSNISSSNEAVPNANTTWYAGSWESTSPEVGTANTYDAIILVGPSGGALTLSTGTYLVAVKILDNPEHPILFSGSISVS